MKTGIELDYDVCDRITLLTLVDSYNTMEGEAQELEYLNDAGNLPDFRVEDLKYTRKMMKHLKKVIKHFGGDPGGRF